MRLGLVRQFSLHHEVPTLTCTHSVSLRDFRAVTASLTMSLHHCCCCSLWLPRCSLLCETRVPSSFGNALWLLDEPSAVSPTGIEPPSAALCWPSVTAAWLSLRRCYGSLLTSLLALFILQKLSLLEISPSPLCN